ncbi:putative glutathione S-transferase [Biscogniauxia mediterranea]|nr:putative glutathione S-transferase [Biscogniauxia mediterranea]
MASGQIVFFDLASKPPNKSWSLNPWKTRFVLNFKGLDYKTEWLQYPDIKPRFKDHFPADKEEYTIPTVTLPDGTWIMDSWEIAQTLEKQKPEPSLHLDAPFLPTVIDLTTKATIELIPIFAARTPKLILDEPSIPYWYETREKSLGAHPDKLEQEKGGDRAISAATPHLQAVTALLKEKSDGPFFLGATPSYADFVWAGFLIFMSKLGDDTKEAVFKATGDAAAQEKLLEAVKPWSARDDH